jgi:hypothetical protein
MILNSLFDHRLVFACIDIVVLVDLLLAAESELGHNFEQGGFDKE